MNPLEEENKIVQENTEEIKIAELSQPQEEVGQNVQVKEELSDVMQKQCFKTSDIPQPPALRQFMEEQLSNPYNKYCIDCKKNQTTHALIWLGAFVCKDCAECHQAFFGGNHFSYVKDVYGELWDDYQLRSVCFGGNQQLFAILKEYGVENEPLGQKYKHPCVAYYRRMHIAEMDNVEFDEAKPPKDLEERLQQTKTALYKQSAILGAGIQNVSGTIGQNLGVYAGNMPDSLKAGAGKLQIGAGSLKDSGMAAGSVAAQKAHKLKEQLIKKEMGTKIMSFFGGAKKQSSQNSQPAEEQKHENQPKE